MKKLLLNFLLIFFLTFSMGSLVSTYSFENYRDGLLALLIGGVSMLAFIFTLYKMFMSGYFDELR